MKRRDFLKKAGKATALAAVAGGTGVLFHNRETHLSKPVVTLRCNFTVSPDQQYPGITLAKHPDPATALNAALDAIGGISRFIKPGESVTIKPNVGWDRTPEQAANTNPVLVGEMVRLCLAAGASKVVVSDVTCNDPRRCFLRSGIRRAAKEAGAQVILPSDEDFVRTNMQQKFLKVLRHFVYTDRLINMPIVKHHSLTQCSLGMKNLYGILGGRRNQLHQEIDQSIVDLAAFCRPTLVVVDATRVLLRGGPQGGSLDYVGIEDSVICGTDQVAVDARAAEFLDLEPSRVSHIRLAARSGLGTLDYQSCGYKEIIV